MAPEISSQRGRLIVWLLTAMFLASGACRRPTPSREDSTLQVDSAAPWFVDRAAETGLDFVHFNGMSGALLQPEMMGAGVALFDYDNDGDLDVFFVQGQTLDPGQPSRAARAPGTDAGSRTGRLYRNDLVVGADGARTLHFTDVTAASGISTRGYGMGVATGDFNNDGCVDLYVTNFGRNQMFRNNCDGTFTDVSRQTGTDDDGWSVSAAFVDYDRDGWLDLFVGHYLNVDLATSKPCFNAAGARDYCLPDAYQAQPSHLYHNNRNGTFTDVTRTAGLQREFGPALGIVAADLNGDGWPDLYVTNDTKENQLWINQHDGTFVNTALLAGAALPIHGRPEASMGVDAGDFDNDGDDDLVMTELGGEGANLYVNDGTGVFEDRSTRSGIEAATLAFTGFGTTWFDFDNDGWLDLLMVNGTVQTIEPQARAHDPLPLKQAKLLLRNLGNGRFENVTRQGGPALSTLNVGRGAAFGDVDNDGALDVIVSNNNGSPQLLMNQAARRHHWVGLRLVGAKPARDMLGARVTVSIPGTGTMRSRRARADGSYASANDPRVVVGLGDSAGNVQVRVDWPDGKHEEWASLPADRYTTLTQGSGR